MTNLTDERTIPRRLNLMSMRKIKERRNRIVSSVMAGPSHVCHLCKKTFSSRATFEEHKINHRMACKYCNRFFKKAFALSAHLKENCEKIPAAVRRKILIKEFNSGRSC